MRLAALILCLASFASTAFAQRAMVIQRADGTYAGIFYLPDGRAIALEYVQVIKAPNPIPPPVPTPGVNPFPVTGLRVLILEEIQDRPKLSREQAIVLNSTKIREYLNSHAAKEGSYLEYRTLDDDFSDADLTAGGVSEMWRKAYRRAIQESSGKLPWIIVSNGTQWESRTLPQTEADTLDLLKKYGGN